MIEPSREQEVRTEGESGLKKACFIELRWPCRTEMQVCCRTSKMRTDWSPEAVAMRESSGLKEMSKTALSWQDRPMYALSAGD